MHVSVAFIKPIATEVFWSQSASALSSVILCPHFKINYDLYGNIYLEGCTHLERMIILELSFQCYAFHEHEQLLLIALKTMIDLVYSIYKLFIIFLECKKFKFDHLLLLSFTCSYILYVYFAFIYESI
jgi:hypothetical protein